MSGSVWFSDTMILGLLAQVDSATGLDATLERSVDLVGVFFFAVSGGLLAVRKGFELVGVVALSLVTALGGGIIRDLVLGATPPTAFDDVLYLVVPLVAAVIVFVAHASIEHRFATPVQLFDAAGLGLFAVTGAVKASAFEANAVGAVLLGVVTATGGGIIRDVLANDPPHLFHPNSRLYAIPAALGATAIVIAWRNDFYSGGFAIAIAFVVFVVRLAAIRFGWRAPKPRGAA
ncbi:MAG: trimeric intracellular cation channel family protein [Ilumatobacter sp.]|uniref:trimeric intracellular cation channel family protein n=1 Tax=Ilumatobacter sp. TaxID=1967498 RepID=UPI00329A5511